MAVECKSSVSEIQVGGCLWVWGRCRGAKSQLPIRVSGTSSLNKNVGTYKKMRLHTKKSDISHLLNSELTAKTKNVGSSSYTRK